MDSETLAFTPAVELAGLIRQKKLSPVELMRALLQRIEALNPRVNAFAHLAADAAMEAARRAETTLMQGERIGRLHGIPVTIKDLAITKDMPTQMGSHIFAGNQPTEDTPVVPRLQAEGAIILGKTTTSEFGWTGVSHCPLTGITHNPWKHGYNAGASSAGAGAAAAAGFGPLHQGSDGAGSIRMPSHFCGVFGLKPTFGRVPYYPVGSGDYTSHMGPMTRTVADSALMLQVMAGPHPLDHTTCEAGPADYLGRLHEGIRGRRIAYSPDLGLARVDPDVAALVKTAAARFTELGATVEEVKTPWARRGSRVDPLLLGGAHGAAAVASGQVGSTDGSRSRRMHQGGARLLRAGLPDDARSQDGVHRRDPSLVRGLGFPADAIGIRCRIPGRTADAEALAAARVGLAVMGGVLLSVQHVLEPRGQRALRLHRRGPAGRPADRRTPLRRPRRAAGVGGVRADRNPGRTNVQNSARLADPTSKGVSSHGVLDVPGHRAGVHPDPRQHVGGRRQGGGVLRGEEIRRGLDAERSAVPRHVHAGAAVPSGQRFRPQHPRSAGRRHICRISRRPTRHRSRK